MHAEAFSKHIEINQTNDKDIGKASFQLQITDRSLMFVLTRRSIVSVMILTF